MWKIIASNNIYDMAVFMCAFSVHELCHFITAKCAGVKLFVGGAKLFGLDVRMKEEKSVYKKLAVYSSGIFANILCAALSSLYGTVVGDNTYYFMSANLIIAFINMIPSFPLDGGRILCCVLEMFMPEVKAVRITASVGDMFGAVLFFFGIYIFLFYTDNILLAVIAVFLLYHNEREITLNNARYVRELLSGYI